MTEDEARNNWCPFYMVTAGNESHHPVDNRGQVCHQNNVPKCLGSGCMAWRTSHWEYEDHLIRDGVNTPDDDKPDGDGWFFDRLTETIYPGLETRLSPVFKRRDIWRRKVAQHGYCGLAGKP